MSEGPARKRSLLAYLPLAIFGALVLVFLVRLFSGDPARLPSVLIGKPVPVFSLPGVDGLPQPGFSQRELATGQVTLVNVFASWCVPCQQEHPILMELAKDTRFRIFGINQKDSAENARRFLARLGNPYTAIGADGDGRASIEWGIYGVPETFVVSPDGRIAFKHVGPLSEEIVRTKLMPEIEKAANGSK